MKTYVKKIKKLFKENEKVLSFFVIFGLCIFIIAILSISLNALDVISNSTSSSGSNNAKGANVVPEHNYPPVKYDPLDITTFLKQGAKYTKLSIILGAVAGISSVLAIGLAIFLGIAKKKNINFKNKNATAFIGGALILLTITGISLSIPAIYFGTTKEIKGLNDFLIVKKDFINKFVGILTDAGNAYKEKIAALKENVKGISDVKASEGGQVQIFNILGQEFQNLKDNFMIPTLKNYVSKYGYEAGAELSGILDLGLGISNKFLSIDNLSRLDTNLRVPDGFSVNDIIILTSIASGSLRSINADVAHQLFVNHQELINLVLEKSKNMLNYIDGQLYHYV